MSALVRLLAAVKDLQTPKYVAVTMNRRLHGMDRSRIEVDESGIKVGESG